MIKKLQAVAVFVFVFSTMAWAQQDPFVGTWKQNLAKSVYDPASLTPKMGNTLKRDAVGTDGIKTTVDGMDSQGNKTHTEYTCKFDGKDCTVTGSPDYNTQSIKKYGSNTWLIVNKKDGAVVRMLRGTVSNGGKTYTSITVGVDAKGNAFHNVAVYDKQ